MSGQLDALDGMASQGLADSRKRTPEGIRELISRLRAALFPEVTDEQAEQLARAMEERIGVSMGLGAVVDSKDFKPWLNDAKASIDPYYWDRYKKLLVSQKLPQDVVSTMDEVTEKILGRLGNPHDASTWDRRGMVVGHVQSGKTANYAGLICKAADAGYRFIVVIAGIHNNLRNQTQARIDEGFIGRDTGRLSSAGTRERPKQFGVAQFDDRHVPVSLTNTIKDFNKATATTNTSQIGSYAVPVVLVIKKNASTLRNLIEWLREHSMNDASEMVDQPMLLIDDEADNASINVKYGKEEVSRINGQIRDLLKLFRRSCYVGYTATPFANIFIDPDQDDDVLNEDLFPRDFIIGLDAPSNYFGPTKVFLDGLPEEGDPVWLRYISDNEDVLPIKHKIEHDLEALPGSMIRALRAFIVARTIRNLRGQASKHASMLVNASRFTRVQGIIRNRLNDRLDRIRNAVRVNASLGDDGLRDPELAELHRVWQEEFSAAWGDWSEIQETLLGTVAAAKVVEVNSRTNDLDYNEGGEVGLTVIAVGGFSLSRGLTLEGLTISYFLRNSMMYDTLMQMGRWFGYRGDYEDLCRIWMPPQAAGWYAHIAEATNELHDELKRMERARATPAQFGLAVRSHPASLLVTARNKIGSGEKHVKIGLSNGFVETTKLTNVTDILDKNREAARRLLADMKSAGFSQGASLPVSGGYLSRDVPVELVDGFLLRFRNDRESIRTATEPIRRYIADRGADELAHWDVLVVSLRGAPDDVPYDNLGWSLHPAKRSVGVEELEHGVLAVSGSRARVASRGVERIGVDEADAEAAEAKYLLDENISDPKQANYPDRIYRSVRRKPLLIVYALSLRLPKGKEGEKTLEDLAEKLPDEPVVAWGISFPISAKEDNTVEYVMNTTMLRELFGDDDQDQAEEMLDDA